MSFYLLWSTAATMSAFHLTTHCSSVQHDHNCSNTVDNTQVVISTQLNSAYLLAYSMMLAVQVCVMNCD